MSSPTLSKIQQTDFLCDSTVGDRANPAAVVALQIRATTNTTLPRQSWFAQAEEYSANANHGNFPNGKGSLVPVEWHCSYAFTSQKVMTKTPLSSQPTLLQLRQTFCWRSGCHPELCLAASREVPADHTLPLPRTILIPTSIITRTDGCSMFAIKLAAYVTSGTAKSILQSSE